MNFNEYQTAALNTALPTAMDLNYLMPGLAAEAGEVAGKWAKAVRDDQGVLTPERKAEIIKELGDTQWFLALICEMLRVELNGVAEQNLDKLNSRKQRGVLGGSGDNR